MFCYIFRKHSLVPSYLIPRYLEPEGMQSKIMGALNLGRASIRVMYSLKPCRRKSGCISCFLKFPELKAVVYASPVYHEQYAFSRAQTLLRSIDLTLGSIAAEVYVIHRTSTKDTCLNWDLKKIIKLGDDLGKSRVQPEANYLRTCDFSASSILSSFDICNSISMESSISGA